MQMLPLSMVLITLALLFYTVAVWSERIAGRLKPWHLLFFWGGLVFDASGTGLMFDLAGELTANIHGVTGVAAILLMLIHTVWATAVVVRKDEKAIVNFHKFSLAVWIAWLVPYCTGGLASM